MSWRSRMSSGQKFTSHASARNRTLLLHRNGSRACFSNNLVTSLLMWCSLAASEEQRSAITYLMEFQHDHR